MGIKTTLVEPEASHNVVRVLSMPVGTLFHSKLGDVIMMKTTGDNAIAVHSSKHSAITVGCSHTYYDECKRRLVDPGVKVILENEG